MPEPVPVLDRATEIGGEGGGPPRRGIGPSRGPFIGEPERGI